MYDRSKKDSKYLLSHFLTGKFNVAKTLETAIISSGQPHINNFPSRFEEFGSEKRNESIWALKTMDMHTYTSRPFDKSQEEWRKTNWMLDGIHVILSDIISQVSYKKSSRSRCLCCSRCFRLQRKWNTSQIWNIRMKALKH